MEIYLYTPNLEILLSDGVVFLNYCIWSSTSNNYISEIIKIESRIYILQFTTLCFRIDFRKLSLMF
jgi:hypothetical protein